MKWKENRWFLVFGVCGCVWVCGILFFLARVSWSLFSWLMACDLSFKTLEMFQVFLMWFDVIANILQLAKPSLATLVVRYVWPIQINVTQDPNNNQTYHTALAQSMTVAEALCQCVSPPSRDGAAAVPYPLSFPIAESSRKPSEWHEICPEVRTVMA